jgi:hypothetical protein
MGRGDSVEPLDARLPEALACGGVAQVDVEHASRVVLVAIERQASIVAEYAPHACRARLRNARSPQPELDPDAGRCDSRDHQGEAAGRLPSVQAVPQGGPA